jgi:hypothetical protein
MDRYDCTRLLPKLLLARLMGTLFGLSGYIDVQSEGLDSARGLERRGVPNDAHSSPCFPY